MDIIKLMLLSRQIKNRRREKNNKVSGIPPLTFTANKTGLLKNYRIYGNTVNGESVGNLVTDSQSEHYGNYAIPITNNSETTNIYLDEPLRMVGDEAEYVDYATQKWHRVRKNLLQNVATSQTINGVTFTVNSDGSIVCDGQASPRTAVLIFSKFLVPSGAYILTGCPNGGSETETYKMLLFINGAWHANDMGSGANFTLTKTSTVSVRIDIYNGYTCNNLTFYPMIRKADIEDDTYEPYIENTEVDVILPGIAVTAGTNTLTVGTEIQPSRVELTGRIKEGES